MSSLAFAALAAGLLGGVHCAGMCGGIAASLSAASRGPALPRQLAFNAGRIASYAAAGAVAGAVGAAAVMAGAALDVRLALFILANVLMAMLGLYVAGWGGGIVRLEGIGRTLWRRIEPLRRHFFPIDTTARALGAGAVWGWIPCGLVYGMLALAAASAGPAQGALVMAAFGLGTLPSLLFAGLAATRVLALRNHRGVRSAAGATLIAMAAIGLARIPVLQEALLAGWHCLG
jgi:sulfite exporter TauE/SafE